MYRLLLEARPHPSHGGRNLFHGCNSGPQNPLWALLGHRVQRLHSGIVKHMAKMETVPAKLKENCNCAKSPLEGGWGKIVCWCSLLDKARKALLSLR